MTILKPDERFRITFDFLVAWLVLSGPTLWISRPWNWELPLYSIIAGVVFLPFATTIVIYCPIMLIQSFLTHRDRRSRVVFKAFGSALVAITVVLAFVFVFGGFRPVDSWIVIVVTAWAVVAMGQRSTRTAKRSQTEK